jgi:hypothetical protein
VDRRARRRDLRSGLNKTVTITKRKDPASDGAERVQGCGAIAALGRAELLCCSLPLAPSQSGPEISVPRGRVTEAVKKRGAFETEAVRVLPLETDRERGAR